MSNAVAKVASGGAVQIQQAQQGGEDILTSNIVIPKVLLMQGLSDLVANRKAIMGDMVRSTTGEKLGDDKSGVDFIPLTFKNEWILREKIGGKFEYRGKEPMTAQNQDAPWEFKKDGADWKRVKSLNVYALLPKDIAAEAAEMEKAKNGEMPDPDKALMPVLISFQSTSFQAGKDLVTHFAKAKKFGVPGYVSTFKLKCYQDKNDKGTYFVYEIEPAGKTSTEQQKQAAYWYGIVSTQAVQVDDSDEGEKVLDESKAQF
jgi:hypothetical protein